MDRTTGHVVTSRRDLPETAASGRSAGRRAFRTTAELENRLGSNRRRPAARRKRGSGALRQLVRQLIAYGSGRPVGHQGGRYLWQLDGSDRLLVAWLADPLATQRENELLGAFAVAYDAYPFANVVGTRS